jgi:8-amino-7-oxononanoate synthase
VLDFTSALYLGLQHPSSSLRPWQALTTGAPAALVEPWSARETARALAQLQGCEAAILAPSTLHLAWDLFGLLAAKPITILMDAGAYPITRWGVQRAAMRGATVRTFPHHNSELLGSRLAAIPRGHTPVIVTDSVCPGCGRVAPLNEYHAVARHRGGLLVTDDTQALGILGHSPTARMPYGKGGGGALRWTGVTGTDVIVFASLAKGLGVPVAVLGGSRERIREFEAKSLTRVHCSPPSLAVLHAAENAVVCNQRDGDARRARLLALVRRFRRGVRRLGHFRTGPGLFPMQTVHPPPGLTAAHLYERLLARGVRTVPRRGASGAPRISFLITAHHTPADIDHTVQILNETIVHPNFQKREIHHENLAAC